MPGHRSGNRPHRHVCLRCMVYKMAVHEHGPEDEKQRFKLEEERG